MDGMINEYPLDGLDMNTYPQNFQDMSRPPP